MKRVLVAKVCCAMRVNGQTQARHSNDSKNKNYIFSIDSSIIFFADSVADAPSGRVRHQHVPFTKGSFMRRHTSHTLRRWKSAHFPFISIQTFPLLILIVLDFFISD